MVVLEALWRWWCTDSVWVDVTVILVGLTMALVGALVFG